MKVSGSYERVKSRIDELARDLSEVKSEETRGRLCDYASREICNDLFTIKVSDGDVYMDCRINSNVGFGIMLDADGNEVSMDIEHGNLTTGEVVVVNTCKVAHTGELEREIHQLKGPLKFTSSQ